MRVVSVYQKTPSRFRRKLRWDDLSLVGRVIACVFFFLLYLGPAHAMSTNKSYPWYLRLLLHLPWLIIGLSLIVPRLNRIPVNPHICGVISVLICSNVVVAATPEGRVPEWALAFAIAGLAALMTGPMLHGYDKKSRDRDTSAERGGDQESPITRDLKS